LTRYFALDLTQKLLLFGKTTFQSYFGDITVPSSVTDISTQPITTNQGIRPSRLPIIKCDRCSFLLLWSVSLISTASYYTANENTGQQLEHVHVFKQVSK